MLTRYLIADRPARIGQHDEHVSGEVPGVEMAEDQMQMLEVIDKCHHIVNTKECHHIVNMAMSFRPSPTQ
jgi:hypothetical protein